MEHLHSMEHASTHLGTPSQHGVVCCEERTCAAKQGRRTAEEEGSQTAVGGAALPQVPRVRDYLLLGATDITSSQHVLQTQYLQTLCLATTARQRQLQSVLPLCNLCRLLALAALRKTACSGYGRKISTMDGQERDGASFGGGAAVQSGFSSF
eukprot:2028860-Rhodomonas_salina.1